HRVVEWDASVIRAAKLTAGPVATGTGFEVDVHFLGQTSTLLYTVLEIVPDTRLVLRGVADRYQVVDTIEFEPAPTGGTALTYRLQVQYSGALQQFAGLLA